jgi:hypothetical protein
VQSCGSRLTAWSGLSRFTPQLAVLRFHSLIFLIRVCLWRNFMSVKVKL